MKSTGAIFILLLWGLACKDTYHFLQGTWQEDMRRPLPAIKHYESFLKDNPTDPRACEVRLRVSSLYRYFGRCEDSTRHLESAARDFPQMTQCVEQAKRNLMTCPDYFPLDQGRSWVYVDSQSLGAAMRLDWQVHQSTGINRHVIDTALYAGNRKIKVQSDVYERQNWALWRKIDNGQEPFLHFPYSTGQKWTTKRNKTIVEWEVMSTTSIVKVAAGTFERCLKVRELDKRYPKTWRFDYYCPEVGRVKTTLGGLGYENPNTELSRFDKIP